MRVSRTAIMFVVVLAGGLGALALAGSRAHHVRAFSLDVPDTRVVAKLTDGQRACEGPIESPAPFGRVRAFAFFTASPAPLDFVVSDARSGRALARGRALAAVGPGAVTATRNAPVFGTVTATLDAPVPAGSRLKVCIAAGSGRIVLGGGSRPAGGLIRLRVAGRRAPNEVSLVMLEVRPQSFFSLLPTIIDRAALFRPGWVGAWTFWALALALLAGAIALGIAVSRVALEDEGRRE